MMLLLVFSGTCLLYSTIPGEGMDILHSLDVRLVLVAVRK